MTFAIPSLASRGPVLILVGCLATLGALLLLADLAITHLRDRRAYAHAGADASYATELHELPDPSTGWSATERGFDPNLILTRIIDGFTPASPPAVLFDALASQMPQVDPSWLTFDTSAWHVVHVASAELEWAST